MGSNEKKSDGEYITKLEQIVLEAIEGEFVEDKVLDALIEIVIFSEAKDQPIFENILDEPLFLRQHFLPWVREGLRIRREIDDASNLDILKGEV